MIPRWLAVTMLSTAAAGCSGEYILTAPDVAAMPGGTAPLVVRLQRREFWFYTPVEPDAPITFGFAEDAVRCGRTGPDGYTSVAVGVPERPGRYRVSLHYQDRQGETASGRADVFVLSPDRPIVAVDLDSLPTGRSGSGAAAAALIRMQRRAQLVYVTEERAGEPVAGHALLTGAGLPDAAVLPWTRRRWWKVGPWWRGDSTAEPLVALQERLPRLVAGVTTDTGAAETFYRAGLKPLIVGRTSSGVASAEHFASWADLALPPPTTMPSAP